MKHLNKLPHNVILTKMGLCDKQKRKFWLMWGSISWVVLFAHWYYAVGCVVKNQFC